VSGGEALALLRGGGAGFSAGISWVPDDVLDALDNEGRGRADALVTLAIALDLDFAFVPADRRWALEAVDRLHHAGIAAVWAVSGVFERVAETHGWAEALRMTAGEPDALAAELDQALHHSMVDARIGLDAGCGAIVVADDLSSNAGWLVVPDFALDALIPCYRQLAVQAAVTGAAAVFHSDGDIRVLLNALARAGYSAVHVGGLRHDALAATWRAARGIGMVTIGGVEAAALTEGAEKSGVLSGQMALAGSLLICDDGGITTADDIASYAAAVEAARREYESGLEIA
jgi:hypothetical protein